MSIQLTSPDKYTFVLEMEVRDYELDCEQIVNNANYLHYMEHTRHKFCASVGYPFMEMHARGIDAVVRKMEIEYISSLRGSEPFFSGLTLERHGARYIFRQDIFRPDGSMVTRASVTIVVVCDGQVTRGDELLDIFKPYISEPHHR